MEPVFLKIAGSTFCLASKSYPKEGRSESLRAFTSFPFIFSPSHGTRAGAPRIFFERMAFPALVQQPRPGTEMEMSSLTSFKPQPLLLKALLFFLSFFLSFLKKGGNNKSPLLFYKWNSSLLDIFFYFLLGP